MLLFCCESGFSQSFLKKNQFVSDKIYGTIPFVLENEYWVLCNEYIRQDRYNLVLAKYDRDGALKQSTNLTKTSAFLSLEKAELLDSNRLFVVLSEPDVNNKRKYQNLIYNSIGQVIWSSKLDSCYTDIKVITDSLYQASFSSFEYDTTSGSYIATESRTHILNRRGVKIMSLVGTYDEMLLNNAYFGIKRSESEKLHNKMYKFSLNGVFEDSLNINEVPCQQIVPYKSYFLVWGRRFDTINPGYESVISKFAYDGKKLDSLVLAKGSANTLSILKGNSGKNLLVYNWLPNSISFWQSQLYSFNENLDTTLKFTYKIDSSHFSFSGSFICEDGGVFGTATHWNQPYQFNIMKTDSIGQVLNSDYLGGVTFLGNGVKVENIDFSDITKLSAYPNPVNSTLFVSSDTPDAMDYILTNINGQLLFNGQFTNSMKLEVANTPNGIYFLQIQGEGFTETRKIIVSH